MAHEAAMTRADVEAFIRRHAEAGARYDTAALAADHTPNGIVESPMFATLQGRAAIEDSYKALFTAFPDWKVTLNTVIIDGLNVAVWNTINATHMNEFFGLPGTQRRVEFQAVSFTTLENGLIARERRIYDFTGFLVQVGVLRAKPAKP